MRDPRPISSVNRPRQAGLTILEMLVSSAMLALIIVGLTAMFIQTQKAFKTGTKQIEVSDTGLTVTRMIAGDLAQMSDGSRFYTNKPVNGLPNVVNLMWEWEGQYVQSEDGVSIRTNQLQNIYILVRTNTGWMGIGYVVSNVDGLGYGSLYRYTSPVNSHFFDNRMLYVPFLPYSTNSANSGGQTLSSISSNVNPRIRLSRIAEGVVHLKIRVYDSSGNQMGAETNRGDYYVGPVENAFPYTNYYVNPPVAVDLPASVDLELGILEPDAWDHLNGLGSPPPGARPGQQNSPAATYLSASAGKVDIFHQRVTVRAATLP